MAILRVRLFDGPAIEREGEETTRFRSLKVQGLLAFLALRLGRRCPREEIAEALWPDGTDVEVKANRLRVTLASLRRQLEPPGVAFGAVIDASVPGCLILREAAAACDVAEFDRAYARGRLDEAAALLRGPLAPGLYDEWIREDQIRYEILRDELRAGVPASAPTASVPRGAPPGDSPSTSPSRLPIYLTRFVGRDEERRRLLAALAGSALVTLTGPGGIGKTRLATETVPALGTPVAFVSLAGEGVESAGEAAESGGEAGVAEAILRSLGIHSRSADAPTDALLTLLSTRPPILLVLDDADGRVDAVAGLVPRLLAGSPRLRILVTSRQRLELPGETVVTVPPLPTPPESAGLDDLAAIPSAALFLDRARSAVPDFALRERHLPAVVAILRRLEGMPLALELAAARAAVQSPERIAEALETNLMELRSRQRGLSERHRSLRAAIQGSLDALAPEARGFFVRLSVFRGGWTASAAREVLDEPDAEARLEELVVRSLVVVTDDRYVFLEPIRAFASELLPSGEAEAIARRHAAHYRRLAARVTEDDLHTLVPLDAEDENLRRALGTVPLDPDGADAGEDPGLFWSALAGALLHAFVRGRHRQAVRWIEATADRIAAVASPTLRFRWRYAAAQILPDVGRLDETAEIARAMRADAERVGDPVGEVHATVILAYVEEARGDVVAALSLGGDALARARELGDRPLLEACLSHRSGTLHVFGAGVGANTDLGRAALLEAEALARELRALVPPRSRRLPLAHLLLGAALWPQERLAEAVESYWRAESAAIGLGTTTELMYAFVSEASIALERDLDAEAAGFYGAFLALQERMGYSLARAQSARPPWIERLAPTLRARLGDAAFERLVAEGRSTPPATLVARRRG